MGGAWRYLLAQLVKHDAQQHGKTNKRLKSEISVMPTLRIRFRDQFLLHFSVLISLDKSILVA